MITVWSFIYSICFLFQIHVACWYLTPIFTGCCSTISNNRWYQIKSNRCWRSWGLFTFSFIDSITTNSLHKNLFRPQANRASKPWKSTSPNFILLAQKKLVIFQIWGWASVCYSSFIVFFYYFKHYLSL